MKPLRERLQLKDDARGFLVDVPQDVELGVEHDPAGTDFAIVFVADKAAIDAHAAEAIAALREDGILWFCYPKKSSGVETDISRDQGWDSVAELGWRGVRQVSVDDTWSALRFRDEQFVKKR